MKRKHKGYSRPKRPFDKARIEEEAKIKEEHGLKNKIEIWRADSAVKSIRSKAIRLIPESKEKQKALFDRLKKIGFKIDSISDVLSLDKRDYLNRRLQTIVFKKRIVRSSRQARQMIVHKKILVDGKVIDSPSYIVPIELEDKISVKIKKPTEVAAKNE